MLKIDLNRDKEACLIRMSGMAADILAEMHIAVECFAKSFLSNHVKAGGEREVAMKMAEGFATAVRDAYKEVMEAKKNAD